MTPTVVATGSLTPVTLPLLFGRFYRERLTGCLHVEHGGLSRAWFQEGLPVGTNVFTHFRPFGQVLLEQGVIDIDSLGRSLAAMAQSHRLQGEVLVEMGVIGRMELLRGLRKQHTANLDVLLQVQGGKFQVEVDVDLPRWLLDLPLNPHDAVLRLLRAPQAAERVDLLLALTGGRPLTLSPEWEIEAPRFDLTPGELGELERLRTPRTLVDLIVQSDVEPLRLKAIVAALSCFRLVQQGE